MKINTDGVLLGSLAGSGKPVSILDIGTGTGVIALMLAQRFETANVDAVEIEAAAAQTALKNFRESPFAVRLNAYAVSFEAFFDQYPAMKYDLIITNPPFYIDSLKSPGAKKTLAKHTDIDFFERLMKYASAHLTAEGDFWLIIPFNFYEQLVTLTSGFSLFLKSVIRVSSYTHAQPHRVIVCFGFDKTLPQISSLLIYRSEGVYSDEYKLLLKPYFLAF